MTTENDGQGVVRDAVRGEGDNGSLDKMCAHITKSWVALHDSNKDDAATRDLVALGLQHTAQLIGAIKTLQMVLSTQPGPTGEYPDGQLNENDEGELRIQVSHEKGNVVLNFGKKVEWFAMPAKQVDSLCEMLQQHADEVRDGE